MILKAYETVSFGKNILLTKLNGCVGLLSRARVSESDGLHRSVAQCINTSPRQLFNRKAGLEPTCFLEAMKWDALCVYKLIIKARVLFTVKRAVQVIVAALVVSRGAERNLLIDRLGWDNPRK